MTDLIILAILVGLIQYICFPQKPSNNIEQQRDKQIVDWFTKF